MCNVRFCTYSLPLRLSALPLSEGKPLHAIVRVNFEKSPNNAMNFLPLKGEMSTDRGVEQWVIIRIVI